MLEKLGILAPSDDDIKRMLAGTVHLGTSNCTHAMSDYVVNRKGNDRQYILNLEKFWDKLILAARVIVAIEEPKDVCVISARPAGKRAVIKYAFHTDASQLPDRFTPGTFTNQKQSKVFMEPRVLILTDPVTDRQALQESSYVNIPVIALCNTDSDLQFVDIAIPCNNRSKESIALIYWFLARTVRRMRGLLAHNEEFDVPVDLFYQRDLDEIQEEDAEEEDPYAVAAAGITDPNATMAPMAQGTAQAADEWDLAENPAGEAQWPADAQYATQWDPSATQMGQPQDGQQMTGQMTTGGMVDPNQQQYVQQDMGYGQPQYGQPMGQQTYDPMAQQQVAQPQADPYAGMETNAGGFFPEPQVEDW